MLDRGCSPSQTYHKKEMPVRIKYDAQAGMLPMRKSNSAYIDPEQHRGGLVNVVTGKVVVHPSVKVNNAAILGENQMETFSRKPAWWFSRYHNQEND